MAEIKRAPGANEVAGPFDGLSAEMFGQFAMNYWPAVLGGISLFLLIAFGKERLAIPVGILVILLQGYLLFG